MQMRHRFLSNPSVLIKAIDSATDSHSSNNERTRSLLRIDCVNEKLKPLLRISIALELPIAQFVVDRYTECDIQHNVTICEFMAQSRILFATPLGRKVYHLFRVHMTQYFRTIYEPVYHYNPDPDDSEDDDDDDESVSSQSKKPKSDDDRGGYESNDTESKSLRIAPSSLRMPIVTYFVHHIHSDLRSNPLNRVSQMDILFVPQSRPIIDNECFESLGVKYETLGADRNMYRMFKRFNQQLGGRNRRCVLRIVALNDPNTAVIHIYEPVHHNTVHADIEVRDFTEIAYIANTKTLARKCNHCEYSPFEPTPKSSFADDVLCLSIHTHDITEEGQVVSKDSRVERVYKTDGTRNVRVFKRSLKATLKRFGVREEEDFNDIDWDDSVEHLEFQDPMYQVFVDSLFPDF